MSLSLRQLLEGLEKEVEAPASSTSISADTHL